MAARFERKEREPGVPIWVGKYRNLHNLPHWHIEHELIACRGGSAELMADGESVHLTDGMAAFCPSGCVHHIESGEDATLLVAQAAPELVSFLGAARLVSPGFRDRYGIFEGIGEILTELEAQRPYYPERANAVLVRLLIDVFRGEPTAPEGTAQGDPRSRRAIAQYRELLSAIDAESEFLTFSEAAARMHMSEAHFSRFFKTYAGMTFSEYLNLVKVDKAIGIMRAEPRISTSDLALRCGFNTLRTFNRVFRSVTGFSPRQLPEDFTLHLRQYAVPGGAFDPTLGGTVLLTGDETVS